MPRASRATRLAVRGAAGDRRRRQPAVRATRDGSVGSPSDPGLGGGGGTGEATLVVPRPGTNNPHPVGVETLEPSVDGRHVLVKVSWRSGVEPCYVLDSVNVVARRHRHRHHGRRGLRPTWTRCASRSPSTKATIVDLGELEPGDYTIRSPTATAPPIEITVS